MINNASPVTFHNVDIRVWIEKPRTAEITSIVPEFGSFKREQVSLAGSYATATGVWYIAPLVGGDHPSLRIMIDVPGAVVGDYVNVRAQLVHTEPAVSIAGAVQTFVVKFID